jgi:hypothetical protein
MGKLTNIVENMARVPVRMTAAAHLAQNKDLYPTVPSTDFKVRLGSNG